MDKKHWNHTNASRNRWNKHLNQTSEPLRHKGSGAASTHSSLIHSNPCQEITCSFTSVHNMQKSYRAFHQAIRLLVTGSPEMGKVEQKNITQEQFSFLECDLFIDSLFSLLRGASILGFFFECCKHRMSKSLAASRRGPKMWTYPLSWSKIEKNWQKMTEKFDRIFHSAIEHQPHKQVLKVGTGMKPWIRPAHYGLRTREVNAAVF